MDGYQHLGRAAEDKRRDDYLRSLGIATVRRNGGFLAAEEWGSAEACALWIREQVERRRARLDAEGFDAA